MYWAIGILTIVFLVIGICGMSNTSVTTPQERNDRPYDQEQDDTDTISYRVINHNGDRN